MSSSDAEHSEERIEILEQLHAELVRSLDVHIETFDALGKRSALLLQINGVVVGIFLAAAGELGRGLLTNPVVATVIFPFLSSSICATRAFLVTSTYDGLKPERAEYLKDELYDGSYTKEWLFKKMIGEINSEDDQIGSGYTFWVDELEENIKRRAKRLRYATVLFATGILITPTYTIIWLACVQ